MHGRPPPRGAPRGAACTEVVTSVAMGLGVFLYIRLAACFGLVGCIVRLCVALCFFFAATHRGYLCEFARRMCPALLRHHNAQDRKIWWWFAFVKYGAVAALEVCTCIARLAVGHVSESFITWVPALLLAGNIFACVVVEARIAFCYRKYRAASVASGALINALTGSVLTLCVIHEATNTPAAALHDGFSYNHFSTFVPAYMWWNIKFASVAQDNATVWHIGHSHAIAFLSWYFFDTDYMDYRVPALHYHFSIGLIAEGIKRSGSSRSNDSGRMTIMQRVGYGAFYDHFMKEAWMIVTAACSAACTTVHVFSYVTIDPNKSI